MGFLHQPGDLARVTHLNAAYRERFGFPFVICVRGRSVAEILAAVHVKAHVRLFMN